ncbi:MAG: alpha/beta fold hydrolase [Gammaproteobacteria bacterium]|nr:alpha/beta fold hydrolase [Gammaproteobacteria bacterium]
MIERQYATVDTRWGVKQIHYRRCGSGPAALLLHQSPQSSREYEALMHAWSDRFTVIAPDYPGFGNSDPLGEDGELELSLADFAEVLIAFLDAINVRSAPAYGFHTGAGMAVAMADCSPAHISAVYANGYCILTEQEQADILAGYLPPFEKHWDGSHLIWVSTRNRDQLIFFPWFDRREEARIERTIPPPEVLQDWAMELLRADDHYRVGYRAAFCYPGDVPLRTLQTPAIITATETDVLGAYLSRVTEPADAVTARIGGSMDDNLAEAADFFLRHPGSPVPPAPVTAPVAGRFWNRTVKYEHGCVRVRCRLDADSRPVLIVHEAAGACETVAALAAELGETRSVITLDLPGHGETDALPDGVSFMDACAAAISAVLDALYVDVADACGFGEGALVLADFVRRHPGRLSGLYAAGLPELSAHEAAALAERFAPAIEPQWHGGHLLEYWHVARNRTLFSPWFEQTDAASLSGDPHTDADEIHQRALALMKSVAVLPRAARELFTYPLVGVAEVPDVPVQRAAAPLATDILDFFAGASDD